MRSDEYRRIAQLRLLARAQLAQPAYDELRLDRTAPEQRRTDVEDERPIRREPDAAAEVGSRAGRHAREPVVVALRAGDDNAICRNAMQSNRLVPLCVVPHQHALRQVAD